MSISNGMKKRRFCAYLALALVFLWPSPLLAQAVEAPERSLTISPLQFEYQVEPGGSRGGQMSVRNKGQQYLRVHMYSQTFKVRGEDYGDYEFVGADPTDAGGWVSFSPAEFDLAPGQVTEVDFTVLPPQQAAPGGHYGVLFADAEGTKDQQLSVNTRAGALAFLQVNGELQKFGEVVSFKTNWWQPSQPLTAELRLHNQGNTHFRALGQVDYKNIFGLAHYQAPINGLVLPQTIRRFSLKTNPTDLIPGIYVVSGKVDIFEQTVKLPPRLVVVLPPLYIVGLVIALVGVSWWWLKRRRAQQKLPRPKRAYT